MFGKNNTLMMGKVFIFSRTTVFEACAILTGATSVQPGVSYLQNGTEEIGFFSQTALAWTACSPSLYHKGFKLIESFKRSLAAHPKYLREVEGLGLDLLLLHSSNHLPATTSRTF